MNIATTRDLCRSLLDLMCLFLLISCCTSCSRPILSIQSEFLRREQLASYHVQVADPMLNQPLIGKRVLLQWTIPSSYFDYEDLHIELSIRFGDRSEQTICLKPLHKSGTYTYLLRDNAFTERNGILAYKAELIGGECVLAEWRHQLWTEIIHIGHDPENDEEDEDGEWEDYNLEQVPGKKIVNEPVPVPVPENLVQNPVFGHGNGHGLVHDFFTGTAV